LTHGPAYVILDQTFKNRQKASLTGLAVGIELAMPAQNVRVTPRLKSLAARQWDDFRRAEPGTAFADPEMSLTLDEAYAVQIETARLRCAAGDAVAGYKIGCIGAGVVEQFGMSGPIHARIFRSEIRSSGEPLRHEGFNNPAIEGEMALRIGDDGRIAAAFPVIELHQFVFRGPRKTLAELVANNGVNVGIVVPGEFETTPPEKWAQARTLSIAINGKLVDAGSLWAFSGGAGASVDWLRNDLDRFGEVLKAGDIVLAGTPLSLHRVRAGDRVTVFVDDREYVNCNFA
jgi:2-keto-4-pentenoate hydratase